MSLKDKKYYDEDPTIYNGENPHEDMSNYSVKYEDLKKAVLEFSKVIEDEEINCCDTPISIRLKDRLEEIFGDFTDSDQQDQEQKRLYVYRYVCPICNYDFENKEDAVECCGGEE